VRIKNLKDKHLWTKTLIRIYTLKFGYHDLTCVGKRETLYCGGRLSRSSSALQRLIFLCGWYLTIRLWIGITYIREEDMVQVGAHFFNICEESNNHLVID
jgi:hypothetical protein